MCENCERIERKYFDKAWKAYKRSKSLSWVDFMGKPNSLGSVYIKAMTKALKNCREPFKAGKGSSKTGAVK